MLNDILTDLYFGRVIPWENKCENSPEVIEVNKRIDECISLITERLDADGKAQLEQLMRERSDLEGLAVCQGFKVGFRLGARLMTAVFDGHKPL